MKSVEIRSFFWPVFSPNAGKYGPKETPYLDTFDAVTIMYVNKKENRIKFIIIAEYYLELWTPETMKLLGSTKTKITKVKMVKMCLI